MSRSLRTNLAQPALEHAIWPRSRDQRDLSRLVHHSDKGVQYLAIRYTERLAESGIEASVGSTGDSYDNAAAEALNKLYKKELIWRHGPWRGLDDVELATLEWVDWYNNSRLHGHCGVPRQVVGRISSVSKVGMAGSARPRCTSSGRFQEIAS